MSRYLGNIQTGRLEWIGLRPERKAPMRAVKQALAIADRGLQGDRRMLGSKGAARQITIISDEFIRSIAVNLGREFISPDLLRRNLVVSGFNLNALRYQHIQIGEAVFQLTAKCHPCSRMDSTLGEGGLAAMLGYGGMCANIIESGKIQCGDAVVYLPPGTYQDRQMSLC
ncbi:MOSC domain-containing protein YiiM [Zhongshania antarctica]|uniref:MOSC domain-containing protein YiiM n=1 Tax=Zhongshania antarctica TaxID=641702 RepID=A0A840R145_9GAMM|nr:MOSC domain-containing protein [Zhongshania antarctica]MBB5186829.1 MOSC domain-containing protein YiiM [Zhongshania antarctica]